MNECLSECMIKNVIFQDVFALVSFVISLQKEQGEIMCINVKLKIIHTYRDAYILFSTYSFKEYQV